MKRLVLKVVRMKVMRVTNTEGNMDHYATFGRFFLMMFSDVLCLNCVTSAVLCLFVH